MNAFSPARRSSGLSLISLMISITIVGILASIAYPSYEAQMQKSRRSDAINALSDLANRMERYYTRTNNYNTATIDVTSSTDVLANAATTQGFYTLSIVGGSTTQTTYLLKATRVSGGPQANDTLCGDLTLSSTGVKGETGTGNVDQCW